MKKKNKVKTIAIIILTILLLIALGYIAYDKVIIQEKDVTTKTLKPDEKDESTDLITEEEAKTILKTKVDFAEKYFTTYANPCGEGAEIDYSIKHPEGREYYQSKEYSSFNELNDSLLKHMSQEVINLRGLYTKDNYLEQNGKLYCDSLAGGSLVTYQPEKTEYTVNEITNNSITATVVSYIESGDSGMTEYDVTRNINVTLTKNGDNWQITKYEGNKIDFFAN